MTDRRRPTRSVPAASRAVRIWLFAVAAMVALTAVVGAATRLTGSGLSITEWAPIMGVVPPLSDAAWQEAFARYREIPQYKLLNKGMSLDAFKTIFWWEWGHRFLARSVGAVFAVPLVVLWLRGAIAPRLLPRLVGILGLGALQGFVGWYMVRSGLVERVDVSQYRLALHLGLAVLIFALLIATITEARGRGHGVHLATLTRGDRALAWVLAAVTFLQVLLGALVAGLKAGRTYNTWPLMDGALVPDGLALMQPLWVNLFENAATVQLNHRLAAYVLLGLAVVHAVRLQGRADDAGIRRSAWTIAALVLGQAALGVWTLLAWVPLSLGVAHQGGAFIVVGVVARHLVLMRTAVAGRATEAA